jgi:hypothetical protein
MTSEMSCTVNDITRQFLITEATAVRLYRQNTTDETQATLLSTQERKGNDGSLSTTGLEEESNLHRIMTLWHAAVFCGSIKQRL